MYRSLLKVAVESDQNIGVISNIDSHKKIFAQANIGELIHILRVEEASEDENVIYCLIGCNMPSIAIHHNTGGRETNLVIHSC